MLGLLAVAHGRAVSSTAIVDVLRRDRSPPATAVNVIQTHVMRLRRCLEPDRPARARSRVVSQIGDGYALLTSVVAVDLLHFRQLVDAAAEAQLAGEDRRAARLPQEALGLWQGPPLVDVPALAGHPAVVGLEAERRAALARYGDLMIALGAATDALPRLEEAAAAQPMDEVAQARLIRAYGAAGQRWQAFATFRDARHRLAEELGVDPVRSCWTRTPNWCGATVPPERARPRTTPCGWRP